MKKLELLGQKFGNLKVLKLLDDRGKYGRTSWLCLCDCGEETTVLGSRLKSGHTRSCGHLEKDNINRTTHGRSKTREYEMWIGTKRRAKKQGIVFTLVVEDIVIPEFCPALGIKINTFRDHHARYNSPSIDKLIPELGYIKDNICVISYRANTIKQNATWQEILAVANWVKSEVEKGRT